LQYHGFLMRRYIFRRTIPYAAVLAVAFGVFALIPVLSVMEGFKEEMRERIRGSLSHLTLTGLYTTTFLGVDEAIDRISQLDHVEAVAPFITSEGIYRAYTIAMCEIRGVDPLAEARVGDFARYLLRPEEIRALVDDPRAELPEGRQPLTEAEIRRIFSLERRRELHRSNVFDEDSEGFAWEDPPQPVVVGIEALRRELTRIGHVISLTSYSPVDLEHRVQSFLVVGAFQSGVFEQDEHWIYMPIQAAARYLDVFDEKALDDRVTGLSIRLDDYRHADAVRRQIEEVIVPGLRNPDVRVLTWEDQRRNLLSAVEIEKRIVSTMMLLIVLFAGFMIFLILMLMVIEKTRDLGVLRSLGATPGGVVRLFLRQGMVLTFLGVLLGIAAGWLLVDNINPLHDAIERATGWTLFPPEVYYLDRIPTRLRAEDWLLVIVPAIVCGYLGSIVPALWAARRDPIQALHHE